MTSADPDRVVRYYDEHAAEFAARHWTVGFEQVHHEAIMHLPPAPARVLDVGAGSGRDAVALARLGHQVVAVEPAAALRRFGEERGRGLAIRWTADRLPGLNLIRSEGRRFDFVLASAVLMHLAGSALNDAFAGIGDVLAGTGRVAVTVRTRSEEDPAKMFNDHEPETVVAAAGAAGLALLDRWTALDVLGRKRVWDGYVFAHA